MMLNLNTVQTSFPSEVLGTSSSEGHFCSIVDDQSHFHDLDEVADCEWNSSTISIDDLPSYQYESSMEDFNEEDGEGPGGILEKMEKDAQCQCHPYSSVTESSKLSYIQSCNVVVLDQNDCVDALFCDKVQSSQFFDSKSDPSSSLMESESEVSICERTEHDTSKRLSLLEILLLHTKESHQDRISIKKMLTPVWKMIATHRFAGPFMIPVKDRHAPGYKEVVKRPMDLTTIKRGLSKGRIKTKAEFQRDILLVFQNCVMYNSVHHVVYHKAIEMQKDVVELLKVLVKVD